MLGADLDQISTDGFDVVLMILTAVSRGVLLGYERQRRGKPVEILTASLVALGSTLFVLSGSLLADTGVPVGDASRLPSMIISGIGFIGGGAIMRSKFNVGYRPRNWSYSSRSASTNYLTSIGFLTF